MELFSILIVMMVKRLHAFKIVYQKEWIILYINLKSTTKQKSEIFLKVLYMHLTLMKNWLWGLLNTALCNHKKSSDLTYLRKDLAVSYQSNTHLSFALAIPFLGVYPREMQTCPHKYLYMTVHSNIIPSSLNWGSRGGEAKSLNVY